MVGFSVNIMIGFIMIGFEAISGCGIMLPAFSSGNRKSKVTILGG
jgi:hypothetical protein